MPKISVVIPTYNRKLNLRRVFAALYKQDFTNFEVIVSDDGSTDNSMESVLEYSERLDIKYLWSVNRGFRAPIVRNRGVRNSSGELIVFIDSDVMLNPAALSHYWNFYEANPDVIVGGRYDWLRPMDFSEVDVYANWERIINNLMPAIPNTEIKGIVGPDPRCENGSKFKDVLDDNYCLALFGGNFSIPKNLFEAVGGFDENMVGHGGEDCEFAMRLQKAGHKAIFTEKTIGYHIYHDRNQEKNADEVKKNIDYIKSKHHNFMVELGIIDGKEGELPLVENEKTA